MSYYFQKLMINLFSTANISYAIFILIVYWYQIIAKNTVDDDNFKGFIKFLNWFNYKLIDNTEICSNLYWTIELCVAMVGN